jgi:hypothetical protein
MNDLGAAVATFETNGLGAAVATSETNALGAAVATFVVTFVATTAAGSERHGGRQKNQVRHLLIAPFEYLVHLLSVLVVSYLAISSLQCHTTTLFLHLVSEIVQGGLSLGSRPQSFSKISPSGAWGTQHRLPCASELTVENVHFLHDNSQSCLFPIEHRGRGEPRCSPFAVSTWLLLTYV